MSARMALGIEYRGTHYGGWQRQPNTTSVQALVEQALGRVAAGAPISLSAAGRTDKGVHGICQIAHFDAPVQRPPHAWLRGGNANLPADIRLLWAQAMADNFHARYNALERRYRYVILNRAVPPAGLHGLVTWQRQPLDVARMREAARPLLGAHDFSAFRASGCQAKTARRTVTRLDIKRLGAWVWLDVHADGFLKHMVRNIVGSLAKIGAGEAPVAWLGSVLASRDRRTAGITAPAAGLYFVTARYGPEYAMPALAQPWSFWGAEGAQ